MNIRCFLQTDFCKLSLMKHSASACFKTHDRVFQTLGRVFQTLGRAFEALRDNHVMFEKLG